MTTTADQLTKGTVIRFTSTALSTAKMTVRLTRPADVDTTENGNTYAIMFGYRVRPADYDVSFGNEKVYCVNVDNIEIVREG